MKDKFENIKHVLIVRAVIEAIKSVCCRITRKQVDNDAYDDNEIEIIRSKEFSLKPMDSEEAVLQMNLLGHDFFVFTDRETDGTSIVYRRKGR